MMIILYIVGALLVLAVSFCAFDDLQQFSPRGLKGFALAVVATPMAVMAIAVIVVGLFWEAASKKFFHV